MIDNLHNELINFKLQYHELEPSNCKTIALHAKSLDAEGINEVMRIKEMADKFNLTTRWDGQNIEIK